MSSKSKDTGKNQKSAVESFAIASNTRLTVLACGDVSPL
jgi:hypothetical protein